MRSAAGLDSGTYGSDLPLCPHRTPLFRATGSHSPPRPTTALAPQSLSPPHALLSHRSPHLCPLRCTRRPQECFGDRAGLSLKGLRDKVLNALAFPSLAALRASPPTPFRPVRCGGRGPAARGRAQLGSAMSGRHRQPGCGAALWAKARPPWPREGAPAPGPRNQRNGSPYRLSGPGRPPREPEGRR